MAELGEKWVEQVLEGQGYKIMKVANEDKLAIKDCLALIIEEKDNKYPVKVGKTRAYTIAGIKAYPFKLKQMGNHTIEVIDNFRKRNIFLNILQVYVVSNMIGRYVSVLRNYNSHIFFINKSYFPVWLKYLEKVYLGDITPFPNMYMGGR